MAAKAPESCIELPGVSLQGGGSSNSSSSERRCIPEAAPLAWLQQLVNNKGMDVLSLQNLMCTSWSVCRAVLRCIQRWRLEVTVSAGCSCLAATTHVSGLRTLVAMHVSSDETRWVTPM